MVGGGAERAASLLGLRPRVPWAVLTARGLRVDCEVTAAHLALWAGVRLRLHSRRRFSAPRHTSPFGLVCVCAYMVGGGAERALHRPHDINWAPVFPSPVGGHVNLEPEQIRALAPGAYGNVSIKSRAVLTLVAGTYTMNSFAVEPQARIVFDDSEGPIYIHVRDMLTYRGDSIVSTSHITRCSPGLLRYSNGVFRCALPWGYPGAPGRNRLG